MVGAAIQATGATHRLVPALTAAAAGAAGLFLAWHHPFGGPAAVAVWLGLAALAARWPVAWMYGVPALLPAIGWMTWTGWLVIEEWDLLVLAAAAGGYVRWSAVRRPAADGVAAPRRGGAVLGLPSLALIVAWLVLLLVSLQRGMADAGGWAFGWWHGYEEPMNSWRVAKSGLLTLLLLPLWMRLLATEGDDAPRALGFGATIGLGLASLFAVWERLAFTDLLNFSSDYRTTALFWEMHVGGAALDGFLALTVPFAVREVLRPAGAWRGAVAAGVLAIGAYASLTTFSRGVYLALPIGLGLMVVLQAAQDRRARLVDRRLSAAVPAWRPALLLGTAFVVLAIGMFPGSGYRGLLALLASSALLLPLAAACRALAGRVLAAAAALGLVAALVLGGIGMLVPKGPYLAFGASWLAGAGALLAIARVERPAALAALLATGAFVATVLQIPLVALHWGGPGALTPAALAAVVLLFALGLGATGRRPRWPASPGWQAGVAAAMTTATLAVGVLMGGAYMEDRFGTRERDLQYRLVHWSSSLRLLDGLDDALLGKGAGRYPAHRFLIGEEDDRVGRHRWQPERGTLHLSAGHHGQSWGALYRVSQRIVPFRGPLTVTVDLRAPAEAGLHVDVCRKHLLYDDGGCLFRSVPVPATDGQARSIELRLEGPGLRRGDWYAPALITFSMAVDRSGRAVEVVGVRAVDADGRDLLRNGDFARGLAHWYFSSDRHHMPWHMKSLPLHVLFEQGWLGLAVLTVLLASTLARLTIGAARDHPMAPAIVAALVAFLVVGLFDSLLDAPRVAFLFYLLALVGLTLPASAHRSGPPD